MKTATAFLTGMVMFAFLAVPVLAQETGDYRTRASGAWSMAQNWERFSGTAWVATATAPTGAERITVQQGDSIFVNTAITISGRLINQGRVAEDGLLTIGDGGVYQHDRDAGTLPQPTWAEGSTLHLTGVTATAPADRNQDYHHIIFETPGLLANLNMNLDDATIGGDIIVRDTGAMRWYLTTAAANETRTVTIMGDVIVEGGQFSVHGTGNAYTTFIIEHYGDVIVTGGNFSISRGSQGFGTTHWFLHEGDFRMSNATTQNSTVTPLGAAFVFTSGETQTLELGAGNTLSSLPIEVRNGTTLDMGSSILSGSGHFLVEEGSIVGTALSGGVTAIFAATHTGQKLLEDESGYLFNGTTAQVTGSLMPTTVAELIIDNSAGVTLSQPTTITEVLRLRSGEFDNTIPFVLGPDATISYEGGTLLHAVSNEGDGELIEGFFVERNFPNPFTASTTVRFGIPVHSQVTVTVYNVLGQRVATAFDGNLSGGAHEISLDLKGMSSGIYVYRIQSDFGTITQQMVLTR
jgi:hypothetical protein